MQKIVVVVMTGKSLVTKKGGSAEDKKRLDGREQYMGLVQLAAAVVNDDLRGLRTSSKAFSDISDLPWSSQNLFLGSTG